MKYIFIVLFCLPLMLIAQQPMEYSEVVSVETLTKDQIYTTARKWVAENFKSANNVVQMDDKEAGEIVGKGTIKYVPTFFAGSLTVKGYVDFTFKIAVKDGRYKYTFQDFVHNGTPSGNMDAVNIGPLTNDKEPPTKFGFMASKGWRQKAWDDVKKQTDENVKVAIASLLKAMTSTKQDDNW